MGRGQSALLQVCGLGGVQVVRIARRILIRRHVSEAIGCREAMASLVALMVTTLRPIKQMWTT